MARDRSLRRRQKAALDAVLRTTYALLAWPRGEPRTPEGFWGPGDEQRLRESVEELKLFQWVEEHGYGARLVARYPNLRKYFAEFVRLPFAGESGSEPLLEAIRIVRGLDEGEIKSLPADVPKDFVPSELRGATRGKRPGAIQRNAWETGLALALRDALRSGDVYLPDSKKHTSFWDLLVPDARWEETRDESYDDLEHPLPGGIQRRLLDEWQSHLRNATAGTGTTVSPVSSRAN